SSPTAGLPSRTWRRNRYVVTTGVRERWRKRRPRSAARRSRRPGGSTASRLALRFRTTRVIVGIATSWWRWSLNNPILPGGHYLSQVSRTSTHRTTCAYLNGVRDIHVYCCGDGRSRACHAPHEPPLATPATTCSTAATRRKGNIHLYCCGDRRGRVESRHATHRTRLPRRHLL